MNENNEETENEMMKDNNISKNEEHKNESINHLESELLQSNKEDLNENPETNQPNEQNEINKLDLSEKNENDHSIEKEQEQEQEQEEVQEHNDNESKMENEKQNDNNEDDERNQNNGINHNYNISTNETDNSSQIKDPQILMYKESLIKMSSPQIRNEKYNSLKKFEYTFKKKLNENKLKSGHSDDKSEELRKLEETVELTEIEQENI